jgi:gluconate 2-dehydrogenase gamma chain
MDDLDIMDRRALMRNVALLIGATTIPTLAGCKAMMGSDGALDDVQMRLLTAIADTIIPKTDTPGAVDTGVPKQISGMLKEWASAETKAEITGAIAAIGKLDKDFAGLDAVKRKALLVKYDAEALKPGPPSKKKQHALSMMNGPPTMNPDYVRLKSLIINLYYASEAANTKELVFEPVPGKFVASLKVTPETRPFAGVGGLFG